MAPSICTTIKAWISWHISTSIMSSYSTTTFCIATRNKQETRHNNYQPMLDNISALIKQYSVTHFFITLSTTLIYFFVNLPSG